MSIVSKVILSGKIDENSFIDYPAHFNVKQDKAYRLSVHDTSTPFKLKFKQDPDGDDNSVKKNWKVFLPFIKEKPIDFITDYDSPSALVYDCIIDWGDNTTTTIGPNSNGDDWEWNKTDLTHEYDKDIPEVLITISGIFPGFNNKRGLAWENLVEIVEWRTE